MSRLVSFPSMQFLPGSRRERRADERAETLRFLLPVEIRASADAGLRPAPAVRRWHAQRKQPHPAGRRESDLWPRQCAFAAKRGKPDPTFKEGLKSSGSRPGSDSEPSAVTMWFNVGRWSYLGFGGEAPEAEPGGRHRLQSFCWVALLPTAADGH